MNADNINHLVFILFNRMVGKFPLTSTNQRLKNHQFMLVFGNGKLPKLAPVSPGYTRFQMCSEDSNPRDGKKAEAIFQCNLNPRDAFIHFIYQST